MANRDQKNVGKIKRRKHRKMRFDDDYNERQDDKRRKPKRGRKHDDHNDDRHAA